MPGIAVAGQTTPSIQGSYDVRPGHFTHLDHELSRRALQGDARSTRVIVTWQPGATLPTWFTRFAHSGRINILNAHVMVVPNYMLRLLASDPAVASISYDRPTKGANYRTSLAVGTRAVQRVLGYTGAGVGVAVIDSGVAAHDDLTATNGTAYPFGNQRVAAFVDFVNGQLTPYDDNGHGTHVAGIIAGNGTDSSGQKAGMAPNASLVSLKVLDANGRGSISYVIAALDWVVANKDAYNIRVVNLSVGATIQESFLTDPLTLAAKRAVDAGIVVVTAAGNFGKDLAGDGQYGGITAPGNAPWVLTVGASSTMGTPDRGDDTMADYSSRGPTYIDWLAKPDLVAPGTGTVSLAAPGSTLYTTQSAALSAGTTDPGYLPYLSLTGTSMAAPVVAGTVALMLEANPSLTPNAVKALLEYTSQAYAGYDGLTEGAGFLNSLGAVRLARFFAIAQPGATIPVQSMWSKHILWGNHMLSGGVVQPDANAFAQNIVWGSSRSADGDNIVWGSGCRGDACDNIVWGSLRADGDNIVWGSTSRDNIVWGSGLLDNDNIVWGSDCGGGDCDNIVWGSSRGDNIVWSSVGLDGDNIVWGSDCPGCDNIVWGSAGDDNIVWGSAAAGALTWLETMSPVPSWNNGLFDQLSDEQFLGLLPMPMATTSPVITPVTDDSSGGGLLTPVITDPPLIMPQDTSPLQTAPLTTGPMVVTMPATLTGGSL